MVDEKVDLSGRSKELAGELWRSSSLRGKSERDCFRRRVLDFEAALSAQEVFPALTFSSLW